MDQHSLSGRLINVGELNATVTGATLLTSFAAQISAKLIPDSSIDLAGSAISSLLLKDQVSMALRFLEFLPNDRPSIDSRTMLMIGNGRFEEAMSIMRRAGYAMLGAEDPGQRHHHKGEDELRNLGSTAAKMVTYYISAYHLFSRATAWRQAAESLELAARLSTTLGLSTPSAFDLPGKLFNAYLERKQYDSAYSVIARFHHTAKSIIHQLVEKLTVVMYRDGRVEQLLSYPFVGLVGLLDNVIAVRAGKETGTMGWVLLLYSWRLRRHDNRGAAEALWNYIVLARSQPNNSTSLRRPMLLLINVLSMSGSQQGWILGSRPGTGSGAGSRRLMGIREIRQMYQEELDRLDDGERGDFDFLEARAMYGERSEPIRLDVTC